MNHPTPFHDSKTARLKPSIRIITLPGEALRPAHMLSRLVDIWSSSGCRVSIGPCDQLDAAIGIVHVDRTVVPGNCLPELPSNRVLLNQKILDISKRLISDQLIKSKHNDWPGSVIIKTDANYYGGIERGELRPWDIRRIRRRISGLIPWTLMREPPHNDYPVLPSVRDVPDWVWTRQDLIVERFLPERHGDEYALRMWIFMGDQEYSARIFSRHPIVKATRMTHYEYLDEVPPSLREIRQRLGIDFGKFDYVMIDGNPILLDVNKTPTVAIGNNSAGSRLACLANGLDHYL